MTYKEPFTQYVSRNEMSFFSWGDCKLCHDTVIVAVVSKTQKTHTFNPKPVGGTEINPVYDRHFCGGSRS